MKQPIPTNGAQLIQLSGNMENGLNKLGTELASRR